MEKQRQEMKSAHQNTLGTGHTSSKTSHKAIELIKTKKELVESAKGPVRSDLVNGQRMMWCLSLDDVSRAEVTWLMSYRAPAARAGR